MQSQILAITCSLAAAWLAGGLIGVERSFHGRPAGFRTHALVGLASAAVILISRQPEYLPANAFGAGILRLDTTHLGQGVMTGVGFLGAGVIFKEGVSVQGLTTAACIWATAAIGMLFGMEFYAAGALTAAGVLITLIVLRWVEAALPGHVYALAVLRFKAPSAPDEAGLRLMLGEHDVTFADLSYRLAEGGSIYEFSGTLRTSSRESYPKLAARLRTAPEIVEFNLERISK